MKKSSLITLALGVGMMIVSLGSAKTPDGETSSKEIVCDDLQGAAFGLCNEYCKAQDYDLLPDKKPAEKFRENYAMRARTGNSPQDSALCPCFDASDIMRQGIDFNVQKLTGEVLCSDYLPAYIQLRGLRDGKGNSDQLWVANAAFAFPPTTEENQCLFFDEANKVSIVFTALTDDKVFSCLQILLNSRMFQLNNCPSAGPQ